MKTLKNYLSLFLSVLALISCSDNNDDSVANDITLHFDNTFKEEAIVLGDASSPAATKHTSAEGQIHHFSELKYVISNIRLVKADGSEFPYHINDLDKGATVVNQAKPQTLDYVLTTIPAGEYKQIKFGLGVKAELNTLDQARFPGFYAAAGANDTDMMWQWATGYRFTKIEGFYEEDNRALSIHTGSTVDGEKDDPETYTPGVDAYRDVILTLPTHAVVGPSSPKINIRADFDKLLSGKSNTIMIEKGKNDITPGYHSGMEHMTAFVDNLGGDGSSNLSGMFSVSSVEN
ncbi:MAG: MbnP family protein [Sphingobacterium sp.]